MKKIFISFDFEGLAGVSNWEETNTSKRFNLLATEQINSFVKGLKDNKEDVDITICDSHAHGDNLIWENLEKNVKLIKGFPRKYYMIEGLNESFDSIILFGYHSPIGHDGNMDHSYSAGSIYEIKINDKIADEASINSLIASYFNVPLDFMFCDDKACEWISQNISNNISLLESKKSISRFAAEMPAYNKIHKQLYEAGKNLEIGSGFIWDNKFLKDINIKIKLMNTIKTYVASIIPGIEVVDPRTIKFTAENPLELYRYLMTVLGMVRNA